MILLIDNYDSFVFNLARYFNEFGCETEVVRNDRVTIAEVLARKPQAIVLSPGPCTPHDAGISVPLVRQLPADMPLLGVCLGHQAIAEAYGATVVRGHEPVHGRSSLLTHEGNGLFAGLASPLEVGRYHSLVVDESTVRLPLRVTGRTVDGVVMALEHDSRPVFGVQFHPESILTPDGSRIIGNFLRLIGHATVGSPVPERPLPAATTDDFYQRPILTPGVSPLARD